MPVHQVITSARKMKRMVANALGNDPIRYLTELITNADDSYRRLENAASATEEYKNQKKIIRIIYSDKDGQDKAYFEVVDCAEGMTLARIDTVFSSYAGDNAEGETGKTRGIFGQGASDVLQGASIKNKKAQIFSFKDGEISKARYSFSDNNFSFDSDHPSMNAGSIRDMRARYHIDGNGTIFCFGLPDGMKVKKDFLKTQLETAPSLHYLLCQKNREVILEFVNKKGVAQSYPLSSQRYSFANCEELDSIDDSFLFEGQHFQCHLKFYRNNHKEENNLQILVRDENYVIFDNQSFGFERYAPMQSISGELIIEGLYELCKTHLNKADDPDAIISDNRMGFDQRNPFYKVLTDFLLPYLQKVMKEHGDAQHNTDLTKNKRFNDVLRTINEYLKTELEEEIGGGKLPGIEPPANGIAFVRDTISITKGKKYGLKLLINTNVVTEDGVIDLSVNPDAYVALDSSQIPFEVSDASENGLIVKSVQITGSQLTPSNGGVVINAKLGDLSASCYASVVDINIHYPEGGIEFFPKKIRAKVGLPHKATLYIDTKEIPLGTSVSLTCDDGLTLDQDSLEIVEGQLLGDSDVAKIDVITTGGLVDQSYILNASVGDKKAQAIIELSLSEERDSGASGLINGLQITALGPTQSHVNAYINPPDRILYLNSNSVINKLVLGDMSQINPKNPKFGPAENKYVAELITDQVTEAAYIDKKSNLAKITYDEDTDLKSVYQQMENEILKKKRDLFPKIFAALTGSII